MALTSSRLTLRRFHLKDLAFLRRLESDPEVMKSTGLRQVQTEEQSLERLKNHIKKNILSEPLGIWAAFSLGSPDEFVGWSMLVMTEFEGPELGYMIPRALWGKGYATEMASLLLSEADIRLNCSKIFAVSDLDNHASRRVLEKLDFMKSSLSNSERNVFYRTLKAPS